MFVNLGELWGTLGGHLPQMFIVNVSYFKLCQVISSFLHLQSIEILGVKRGCFRAYFQTLKLKGEGFIWQKETPSKKPL